MQNIQYTYTNYLPSYIIDLSVKVELMYLFSIFSKIIIRKYFKNIPKRQLCFENSNQFPTSGCF